MFNENSIIVKTWVNLVKKGVYTVEQVPNLGNLKEAVTDILIQVVEI